MKNIRFLAFISLCLLSYSINGQQTLPTDTCSLGRFSPGLTSYSFASVNTTDIVYGVNSTRNIARVYTPVGDVNTCRPVIIWAHGGGFVSGSYLELKTTEMMTDFARKGYIAIAISYRLWPSTPTSALEYQEAMIRGVQDMIAAIRFVRANATAFGADTSQIFIGGSSAGAIIANHTTFMDESEAFPTALANQGGNFNVSTLSTNLTESYQVAGCVSQAGAIWDMSFLYGENIPWGAVHNTSDGVVSYNTGGGSLQIYNQLQSQNVKSFLKLTSSPGLHTPFPLTPTAAYVDTFNSASYAQLFAMLKHHESAFISTSATTLTAEPSGLSYQWFFNGTIMLGETSQSISPTSNGQYHVVIQNCANCFSTSDTINFTLPSSNLEDYSNQSSTIFFPTPCRDVLNFKNTNNIESLMVYTISGQQLYIHNLNNEMNSINTSSWKEGVYFAEIIYSNGDKQTTKILKIH